MRAVRGAEIGLVLQNPLAALNPALRIGTQFLEAWRPTPKAAQKRSNSTSWLRCRSQPAGRSVTSCAAIRSSLSVGMAQRVLIAMAIAAPSAARHRGRAHQRARRPHASRHSRALRAIKPAARHRHAVHFARFALGRQSLPPRRDSASRPDRRAGSYSLDFPSPATPVHAPTAGRLPRIPAAPASATERRC